MVTIGPLTLVELIGRGGMGEVWKASIAGRTDLGVAIKVLTMERARTERFRAQFREEVRAAAALSHPNIIEVIDHGQIPLEAPGHLAPGSPFMAMELCARGSLAARAGRFAWSDARRVLLELLAALGHAHARGLVHLDIKPENVLTGDDGAARLSDFGVAHALEREQGDVHVGGTPRYMAPEQLEGRWRDYGPSTDLFAVGRLALRLPAEGSPVPRGLSGWVRRLLAQRPQDRYPSAADAAWELEALGDTAARFDPSGAGDGCAATKTATATASPSLDLDRPARDATDADAEVLAPSDTPARPVPERWRQEAARRLDLRGMGLGLFGLRQVGLAGREHERSVLWELLRAVHAGGAQLALVRGPAGTGKSRLAAWLREQAHEAGAAFSLKAVHGAAAGQTDGIGGMIRRHFRCAGLASGALRTHLERAVRAQGADAPYEWNALAALCDPGAAEDPGAVGAVRFTSPTERYVVVSRLCERIARGRPVVVWLDDVQWGADALGLARHLLDGSTPVLIVATLRDEALAERPIERGLIDDLLARPRVTTLPLEPLPASAHRLLCRDLLGLSAELSARVEERTAGNPLFAVQLVGDWVMRGVLEPGAGGFSLQPSASEDLPRDLFEVWAARVDRLLESAPPTSESALEIASLLGRDIDPAEWRDACAAASLPAEQNAALLDAMLAARLARASQDGVAAGWSLVHPMLRESLEQRARDAGRLPGLHRACARMLEARGARGTERRAAHLLAAGDHADAVAPLLVAARARLREGAGAIAAALLDDRERALRAIGAPESDLRWAMGWVEIGHAARLRLEMDLAASLNRRAAEASGGDADLKLRALFGLSDVHRESGKHALAAEVLEEAAPLAEAAGPRTRGELYRRQGHLAKARGDLSGALALSERALAESADAGDDHAVATAALLLATVLWRQGRLTDGAAHAGRARATYERLGSHWGIASCENTLGEMARLSGDFDAAVAHYKRALAESRAIGSKHAVLAEVNVGLVLVEQGRLEEARPIFETGLPVLTGSPHVAAWLHAALLPCVAAAGEADRWDRHFDAVEAVARTWVDADLARMVVLGGDRAAAPWPDRSGRAYALALAQWRAMGRDDEAAAVEAKLAQPR